MTPGAEVGVSCSKKTGEKPVPGGFVCQRCGVGAKKKKKLCEPEKVSKR